MLVNVGVLISYLPVKYIPRWKNHPTRRKNPGLVEITVRVIFGIYYDLFKLSYSYIKVFLSAHECVSTLRNPKFLGDCQVYFRVVTRYVTTKFFISEGYFDEVEVDVIPLDECGVVLEVPYMYMRDAIFMRRADQY